MLYQDALETYFRKKKKKKFSVRDSKIPKTLNAILKTNGNNPTTILMFIVKATGPEI